MLRTILLLAICLYALQPLCAQAPFQFMNDANGRPLFMQTNYTAEGSPYFNEEYMVVEITTPDGAAYTNVRIKINLADHIIQYMNREGREMITDMPVKQVKFTQYVFEDGQLGELTLASYGTPINAADTRVYQVVSSGKITLLKSIAISWRDEKKYGSASITRIFERKEAYSVLLPDGKIKRLEKGRTAILALFPDRQKEVALFIEQNKLKCNSGKDYEKLFRFYNTSMATL